MGKIVRGSLKGNGNEKLKLAIAWGLTVSVNSVEYDYIDYDNSSNTFLVHIPDINSVVSIWLLFKMILGYI